DKREKPSSIIHKAYKHSKLCDANLCLGIRIRRNGQMTTSHADSLDSVRIRVSDGK
ncbi:hypothetical protein BO82DRAFT_298901, partial [Aspergillus uvarum CBS 121591]